MPLSSTFGVRMSAGGPCVSCNAPGQCRLLHRGARGRAYCRARERQKPRSALLEFFTKRLAKCVVGGVGGQFFTPFADELLRKRALKSRKGALRALRKAIRRSRRAVRKGKVRPGLAGCVGGALGI